MFDYGYPERRLVDWRRDGFHTRGWREGPPPDWDRLHTDAEEATLR